jgi:hypothetical protein
MNLDWDYTGQAVHVSMLDHVPKALASFQHKPPRTPQHQPYPHIKPTYGATAQYNNDVATTSLLDKEGKKYSRRIHHAQRAHYQQQYFTSPTAQ